MALDQTCIDNLKMLGEKTGKDLLSQLVGLYLNATPETLSQMDRDLAAENLESVARAAHTLKSSSGNVGAMELSGLSAELELYIVEGEKKTEVVSEKVKKVHELFAEAKGELEKLIAA